MASFLTFPRTSYRRQDVMRAKRRLKNPKSWKFKRDKGNFYLIFSKNIVRRLHFEPKGR